jgi:3D (Asp-Asp-Asp) domain-containing protein
MEHEIPEWLVQERKRSSKELSDKIAKVIINSIFYTFLAVLTGCILLAGYSGYLTLKERSVIKYEREHEPEPRHILVSAVVTAYSEIDSCHYKDCVMASGVPAYVGAVACPRNIPINTKVVIEGITYNCEDRTNKSLDGRYDVFIGYGKESHTKALIWGKRELTIKVYTNSYDTAM